MIRWKKRGDLTTIVKLVRQELIPISPHPHESGRKLREDISQRLRQGATLIAYNRGSKPLAFLHLMVQQQTLFIDLLAVDRRSQNRQWGTKLMKFAENHGRKNGCYLAKLFVDEDNTRGIRFYQRLGYTVISHVHTLKCYEMVKAMMPVSMHTSSLPRLQSAGPGM